MYHYWPAVACCPLVSYVAYVSVTDDYRPLLVWPPTLCVGGPVISEADMAALPLFLRYVVLYKVLALERRHKDNTECLLWELLGGEGMSLVDNFHWLCQCFEFPLLSVG